MSYEQAIIEAYADADVTEVALDTLEFRHPNFVDELGNPTSVRVVCANQDYNLRLENSAPVNPSEFVLFQKCAFEIVLPRIESGGAPELEIKVDNVSRELTRYLEMAAQDTTPIAVTYRPYLASDTNGPQMNPPLNMTLTSVTVDVFQVTGKATLSDVHNWPFPFQKYTPERFPGLVR